MNNYVRKPTKGYRFFLYDPEGDGMMYFKTKEDRDAHAKYCLSAYNDPADGWNDGVEYMARGEVTEFPQVMNKKKRPSELDEEDCDYEGTYWNPDWDWIGSYTWECV